MSRATVRAEIAAAISTVPGCRGYEARPAALRTGDGFPRWRGAEIDGASGQLVHDWAVLVAVPPAERDADAWADAHLDQLWEALSTVGWVTGSAPVDLRESEQAPVYGIMIMMRRE